MTKLLGSSAASVKVMVVQSAMETVLGKKKKGVRHAPAISYESELLGPMSVRQGLSSFRDVTAGIACVKMEVYATPTSEEPRDNAYLASMPSTAGCCNDVLVSTLSGTRCGCVRSIFVIF